MSLPVKKTIICKCGNKFNTEVFLSVNVTKDPELKEKVLKGKINSGVCPKCGRKYQILVPFIYHDMNRMFMVEINPQEIGMDKLKNFIEDLEKKYTLEEVEKRRKGAGKEMIKTIKVYLKDGVFYWEGINERGKIIYDNILSETRIREIRIEPEIKDKKIIKVCKHNKLIKIGYWNALKVCGLIVQCKLCGKEFYLTYKEWNVRREALEDRLKAKEARKKWERETKRTEKAFKVAWDEVFKDNDVAEMGNEEFRKKYKQFMEKMEKKNQ